MFGTMPTMPTMPNTHNTMPTMPNTMPNTPKHSSHKSVKRGKYHKLETKPMTDAEKHIFNDWFSLFCTITIQEPVIRTVCVQLRKKAPNAYEKYCGRVNTKPVLMKQFNAAIKHKTGSVPKIRHMRKLAFDHIEFSNVQPGHTRV